MRIAIDRCRRVGRQRATARLPAGDGSEAATRRPFNACHRFQHPRSPPCELGRLEPVRSRRGRPFGSRKPRLQARVRRCCARQSSQGAGKRRRARRSLEIRTGATDEVIGSRGREVARLDRAVEHRATAQPRNPVTGRAVGYSITRFGGLPAGCEISNRSSPAFCSGRISAISA